MKLSLHNSIFTRIGLLSFGGPAAQIALMHKELVEKHALLTENQFLRALSFCMLLPGPEAMQLATYAGWRIGGTRLGILAGLLFIVPGAIVIAVLAALYINFGDVPLVAALFYGVKAAVLVIVLQALLKVSQKALHGMSDWVIAIAAFIAIFALQLPFPLIILIAGCVGYLKTRKPESHKAEKPSVSLAQTFKTILIWSGLWALPIIALTIFAPNALYQELSLFFSKLAIVTFGGAYAVLAYMAQAVVQNFGWLTTEEMIDALGLAETTPGPLILVTEFVGFLAAAKASGSLWAGLMGALITLWVTFVPCFLWIFAGAPYLEWITDQPKLRGALSAITAAVVGVILNLSLWFGLHVLFANLSALSLGPLNIIWPEWAGIEWPAAVIFIVCGIVSFRYRWGLERLLPLAALLGLTTTLIS